MAAAQHSRHKQRSITWRRSPPLLPQVATQRSLQSIRGKFTRGADGSQVHTEAGVAQGTRVGMKQSRYNKAGAIMAAGMGQEVAAQMRE